MGRANSKETTKKWIKSLNEIKQELSENNHERITKIIQSKSISHSWHGFLSSNNIIYKNEFGFYKWNDKIPVTAKLTDKYRLYADEYSLRLKQQPTLFDKSKTNKRRKVNVEFKDKQQQELGLIRRFWRKFWRWIY